jgi:hypothetical protein
MEITMRRGGWFAVLVMALAAPLAVWWWADRGTMTPASLGVDSPHQRGELEPPAIDLDSSESVNGRKVVLDTGATTGAIALGRSLPTTGSVRGRAVDESSAPVADVEVFLKEGKASVARSDSTGRFRFEIELSDGRQLQQLHVCAKKHSYVPCRIEAVARLAEEIDLGDLAMKQGGAVSGRVVDTDGLAIDSARISCTEIRWFDRERARRIGPGPIIAETKSDARGDFLLEGAPPGQVRVWAGKKGMRHSFSEPIEIRAREQSLGPTLVLEPMSNEDTFEIYVRRPDGSPCPGAEIVIGYQCKDGHSGSGNHFADEHGHFTYVVWDVCPHEFRATDADERFGPAIVTDVMPGSGPIVLQLNERAALMLRVTDEHGAAIEKFQVHVVDPNTAAQVGSALEAQAHPGGMVDLSAPAVPFVVVVDAEGFDLAKLGPYEPGAIPREINARLIQLSGVSGRVAGGGKPIQGAKIAMVKAVPSVMYLVVNGFASRCQQFDTANDESDAEGVFHLTLRGSGRFFIRAEKPGWASAEVGPIDLDSRAGAHDLALELTHGGAIEGHLLLPPGQNPSGSIIGISRGDGKARTQRVESDGSFRFERLTPGPWLVKRCAQEITPSGLDRSTGLTSDTVEIPSNCEVHEGATTRFDLDLSVDRRANLTGRLLLGGKPATGWLVFLRSARDMADATEAMEVDAEGYFVLSVAEPASYLLLAHGTVGESSVLDLSQRLELSQGDQSWTADIASFGRVEGHRASNSLEFESDPFLEWQGSRGLQARMPLLIDDQGRFSLSSVPAGRCSIQAWRASGKRELASFDVSSGELTTVELH